MIKLYCTVLLGCLVATQSARSQSIGLKAGANVSWIGGDSEDVVLLLRYHVGLLSNVSLVEDAFTLQPEFYYSSQGTGVGEDGTARYHYFCLPVLAKLEHEKHYFLIGPQAAVLYEGNLRHKEARQNVTAHLNPVDISVVLGGGIKVSPLANIELRYHLGISDTAANNEGNFPNRLIQVSFNHLFTQP